MNTDISFIQKEFDAMMDIFAEEANLYGHYEEEEFPQ